MSGHKLIEARPARRAPYFPSEGIRYTWRLVKGFTRSATTLFSEARAAMRVTSMVAGLAIVLAACGGEKKAEDQPTTATPEQPAAAPAALPLPAAAPLTT